MHGLDCSTEWGHCRCVCSNIQVLEILQPMMN